jgi:hypothetical protein
MWKPVFYLEVKAEAILLYLEAKAEANLFPEGGSQPFIWRSQPFT